jgi:hypothetical protein
MAAIQTIKSGFDRFIVVSADGGETFAGFIQTPTTSTTTANVYGNSYSAYGTATTTTSGGTLVPLSKSRQDLVIQMYHNSDAGSENALDAKVFLGPDWPTLVADGPSDTCL